MVCIIFELVIFLLKYQIKKFSALHCLIKIMLWLKPDPDCRFAFFFSETQTREISIKTFHFPPETLAMVIQVLPYLKICVSMQGLHASILKAQVKIFILRMEYSTFWLLTTLILKKGTILSDLGNDLGLLPGILRNNELTCLPFSVLFISGKIAPRNAWERCSLQHP